MRNQRSPRVFIELSLFPLFFLFTFSHSQELTILPNGQPTPVGTDIGIHQDTPTRQKIDLAGTWSYTLDEERWHDVVIPSAFDYVGRIVFLRQFSISDSLLDNCSFSLVSLGVNYEAEVFVNDIFIGKHTGGSTSFQFDVPEDVIQRGDENAVKIVVSNVLSSRQTLPLRKQIWGWRNYGGIYRDIFILATPRLWVQSLYARPVLADDFRNGSLHVQATISNRNFPGIVAPDTLGRKTSPVNYQLLLELIDPERGGVFTQASPYELTPEDGKDADVSVLFPVAFPRLWSPETPTLYQLSAVIVKVQDKKREIVDEARIAAGFVRTVVANGDLQVNGKNTRIRGIAWHEDAPEFGSAFSYDRMEKDIAQIKALGANAVRFAFHPPHPYVINLCNRYGLFAFVEMPVWNAPAEVLNDEVVQSVGETIAREMVVRDRNHPSIAAWGIGDEFDSSDPRTRGFVERVVRVIRSLDGRPVYYGSKMLESDTCVDLVDFAAVNIPTNDVQTFKELLAGWMKRNPKKPVLVMRYGKTVESGNRNGYSDPISEESQARFFTQYIAAIRESGITGSFIQALTDWRGDRPIMTVEQSDPYLHPVGLLSYDRKKRLAYDLVKTTFAGQKVAALPIGKHRSSFPVVHVVAGFLVIFAVAYQYHYNRRFNESFKRSLLRSYNFFADLRDVRSVSVFHTLFMTVMISLTLGVVLSSLLYHFRDSVMADYVVTQVVVWDVVKEYLVYATWNPLEGILAFAGMFLILSVVLSIPVRISSLFIKSKMQWVHAYTAIVWASVPLVFLSPLGMSLFKILQTPFYVLPSFILLLLFGLWTAVRILKGISVIYELNPAKTYIGGTVVIAACLALVMFFYETEFQITAYLEFLYNLTRSAG